MTIKEILAEYGWRETKSGTVYEGFEHLLNTEIEDWRTEEYFSENKIQ